MKMRGFVLENTLSTGCTTAQLRSIEEKIDRLIQLVEKLDGLRGFGSNVLANILGDVITQKR